WIDDRDMNGARWKAAPGAVQLEGALEHIERPHGMAQVHHGCAAINREDGALHGTDVGILDAEIREQRDDAARLHAAMLSAGRRQNKEPPGGAALIKNLRSSSRASPAPELPSSSRGYPRRGPPSSAAWQRYWRRSGAPSG